MLISRHATLQTLNIKKNSYPARVRGSRFAYRAPSIMSDEHQDKRRRIAASAGGLHADELLQHQSSGSFRVPGLQIIKHTFKVPLDYSGKVQGEIELSVREVVSFPSINKTQPYLLFLQGGPGFETPRPTEASGWIKSALSSFTVVLMDQRGTGKSSQITVKNLGRDRTPEEQAEYLTFFRADSIVRDAEHVRTRLVPNDNFNGRWSVLGQSFGGFCAITYLSMAPEGLLEALITGGIPPNIHEACPADLVYRSLYRRVKTANERFYTRFPDAVDQVQRIVRFLSAQPKGGVQLPSGTLLTPRAFQTLGLSGLGSGGGFERLYYLLDTFFDGEDVNPTFVKSFEAWQSWDTNPLYALMHEAIYCQGAASRWSAQRVRQEPEFCTLFDATAAVTEGRPVMFTGEMVYPWMFEDFAALRPYAAAADILADKGDWGPLYDVNALKKNKVSTAALTYVEDMYVDFQLAQNTASQVHALRQWTTNEYKHSGIRDDGHRIFDRLLAIARSFFMLD